MADIVITKQPFEEQDYSFSFSPQLEATETISLISLKATNLATSEDSSGTIIGDNPAPMISGQSVIFWIKNGNDGDRHGLKIKIQTSGGRKLEGNLWLAVIEEKAPPTFLPREGS